MRLLDIFFTTFHTCLVFFNLFGWIWKKTRVLNLICLLLTAASWVLLGIFYGFGYCPLTDWHFNVLERLGYGDLPDSYLSFLFTRLTGLQIGPVPGGCRYALGTDHRPGIQPDPEFQAQAGG